MDNILQVESLSHSYASHGKRLSVLHEISFGIPANNLVAIQGDSGSGKTTLLLAAGAMQKPTAGIVKINGADIFGLSSAGRSQFRASQIGFMFQSLQLVPYLNVLDNVRMVRGVTADNAKHWLSRLGLQDRLRNKPEALSHGQRQRVALARAIAHRPALVVADEPTGNLDATNSQVVFETLREFADSGAAVLIATHNPSINNFADQTFRIESCKLQEVKANA